MAPAITGDGIPNVWPIPNRAIPTVPAVVQDEPVETETIEQIKVFGAAYIRDLVTVYDDMGVLLLDEEGKVKTSGT